MAEEIIQETENIEQNTAKPKNYEAIRQTILDKGIDVNAMLGATEQVLTKIDPMQATGLEDNYDPELTEYDQGFLMDAVSGLYNGLIISGGEGIANLIPTIAQASGSEAEWTSDWKENVSNWFQGQETIYSDKANQPIEEFGDITSAHVAQGIGQGLGFVLGIMGGGAGLAGGLSKVGVGAKSASRIGSFLTGTTLMYPMVDKEAKAAGLSDVDASRFALGVSGIVSMTEGAALEWIGKLASKPLTSTLTKGAVKETLQGAKTTDPIQLQKLFLKNYSKKIKGGASKIFESAAVETGQEFSQTYIETGAKHAYDIINEGKDKGHFGADITNYQTFVEATFGGLIGGLIGGGMGGFHMSKGGSSLADESLFGYINSSVKNKNVENIDKLTTSVDEMVENKDITADDAVLIKGRIEKFAQFASDYDTTGIQDGVALYQLYQLNDTKKGLDGVKQSMDVSDDANDTLKKQVEEKKGKVDMVTERIQEHFDSIFGSEKAETKNKTKFEDKLTQYGTIVEEINNKNIDDEAINKQLDKLFDPRAKEKQAEKKKEAEMKEAKTTQTTQTTETTEAIKPTETGKTFDAGNGITLTESSLTPEGKQEISDAFNKALESKTTPELKEKLINAITEEYGIDKDAISYIANNMDVTPESLTEIVPQEIKEVVPEEVVEEVVEEEVIPETTEEVVAEPVIEETAKAESQKEQEEEDVTNVVTDEVTTEEQEEIDKKVTKNKEAEQKKVEAMKNLSRKKVLKQQRKGKVDTYEKALISKNPKLYSEVKKHFKKVFPHIPVKEVNRLADKHGAKVLARIVETGIEIDPSKAIQTSLIHEYGHVYLDVLGKNHPLVKLGYKLIEKSQLFKDAQELYPDKTKEEQLEEALNEAIATDSLSILENKFEGAKLAQFQEWLKSIWSKVKSLVGKANQKDVTRLLSRQMTLAKTPFETTMGSLVGMDKDQRNASPIPQRLRKTVDVVSEALTIQLLHVVSDKKSTFDIKSKNDSSFAAYYSLLEQYVDEKENPNAPGTKIFDNVDFGIDTQKDFTYQDIFDFGEKLKEKDSEVHDYAETVVNSMFKANLEMDEVEDIDDEADQEDNSYDKGSDNSIKAAKKVSLSVRSILSSIVDQGGKKIGSDAVFSYVANVAERTYKKAGLIKALEEDRLKDPIAKRILEILDALDTPENSAKRAGFLQEISSLIQVKSEGANFSVIKEGEETKYVTTNPVRNKDRTYNGLADRLDSLTNEQIEWLDFKNIINYGVSEFYTNGVVSDKLNDFLDNLGNILNVEITPADLKNIIDQFSEGKYSKVQNFFYAVGGQYDSLKTVANGDIEFKKITGFMDSIFKGLGMTLLNNTYLNGANNTVTTTQLGHWVSTLNSMLMNKESGRAKEMQDSPIFKNNPVFKYFVEQGKVEFSVFDSLKNFFTGENIEYKDMTGKDYMMLQLFKFATATSKEHYAQTLGVKSNRQSATFFEVPSYSDKNGKFSRSELRSAYDNQVAMLQPILTKMLNQAKTEDAKTDLINDFNSLYIHKADKNGNITSGLSKEAHKEDINKIKILAKANKLDRAFSNKIGNGKQFASFDEMVESFFFIEAINRSSLNDIYGGSALEYANLVAGKKNKGGVQQMVKRLSSSDSNGKQIEIDKPIHYIVYDTPVSGSDSFKFNGSYLTEHIDKETGSLDPLGINSKELVFQVDPKTGQTVYIKSSGLNLKVKSDGTTNLDGFGDNMKAVADAMLAVEKMLATEADPNPYVVFMDASSSKGTKNFKTINFQDVMNGDLSSVEGNVNTIEIDNLTTPFNLNKTLGPVEEQEAILSTQAAIIQFNANSDIKTFEDAAVTYLEDKMKGQRGKPGIVEQLLDYDTNIEELTKDLNERERSATTEILEAIKEHNAIEGNTKITTFDHPSLRAIYEQFVGSRLSKRGTKVEMPGNFMHQLPDMGGVNTKLQGKQVAVPWKMFFTEKPTQAEMDAFLVSENNKVAVVRIPASAEMSMFAGTVGYFLDTDANVVTLSDEFVERSDSDHDGDKAMVYRQDIKGKEFLSSEDSIKSKMFESFYNNLNSADFINKQETTLSLDPLHAAVGKTLSDFKTSVINDVIDVAEKMGLGQVATGRFAIAGKLMSLLSQSGESLKESIMYAGTELKDFTNKSLDDLAILLQAALDIGNDPVLSNTGFNETTINVGNAMLLLGLNTDQVVEFLNLPVTKDLVEDFKDKNLALSENSKLSFDFYFGNLMMIKDKNTGDRRMKNDTELSELTLNGKKVGGKFPVLKKYDEFKKVGDGLSKMIGYIKLDKGLPNNAELNRKLFKDIDEFGALPFTVDGLTDRVLMKHRVEVAKNQRSIYSKQLLTAKTAVLNAIDELAGFTQNAFEFKKKAPESIMKVFAQEQINTPRTNVTEWAYDFANKLKSIKTGNVDSIAVTEDVKDNDTTKAIYTLMNENPLWTKEEAIMDYGNDKSILPKYLDLLSKYEDAVDDFSNVEKFKNNKFIQYLQFAPDENGRTLIKLDPKFKATTQITQDVKDGFKELQDIDPQLANDIIDYQLYRHGVNNKIGSLIDVLPKTIDTNQLLAVAKFKDSLVGKETIEKDMLVENKLADNIIADNVNLLKKIDYNNDIDKMDQNQDNPSWFSPKKDKSLGMYVSFNGRPYKLTNGTYTRLPGIEADENFTSFNNEPAPIKYAPEFEGDLEEAVEEIPNEVILSNGIVLTLPTESVTIETRGGVYSVSPAGVVYNDTQDGSIEVPKNSPLYYHIIEEFQIKQANDLNKNCG